MQKYQIRKDQTKQIVLRDYGEYVVELLEEGASVEILGGFHLGKGDKKKIVLDVIHKAKHTRANTLIRAVVEKDGQIDVRGKIVVEENSSDTESFLQERVLLVSEKAKAVAIPNLEIKNDEVKCSHAATVGRIEEEELFYLMSRGVDKKEAEKMIIEGFLQPVWDKIREKKEKRKKKKEKRKKN